MTNEFKDKKVLVMGLGLHGGGVGAVKFLTKCGAKVIVTDLRSKKVLAPSLQKLHGLKNIKYVLGRHRTEDIIWADFILKNPGVRPDSPYIKAAKKHKIPVTSDIEIFFKECKAPIIAVTGTRGKSTTAYLIWKFLKAGFARVPPAEPMATLGRSRAEARRRRVWLAGNIRKSVLEFLPQVKEKDLVVLELSSFQLEDLAQIRKSPRIAVLTNILLDHLNWHKSLREYIKAKSYIFRFQKSRDYFFYNPDDRRVKQLARTAPSHALPVRLPQELRPIVDQRLGEHYRSSVGLAVAVARHLGISKQVIRKALLSFRGLPSRQEEVANIRGVRFINDTTATTPDAAIAALKRFRPKAAGHKIILIAGGQDKKLKFKELAAEIKKSADKLILLPGTATAKLRHELRIMNYESGNIYSAPSMVQAVKTARGNAKKGDYIILSPGAASFGLFLNEFDRGDQFVKEVKKL